MRNNFVNFYFVCMVLSGLHLFVNGEERQSEIFCYECNPFNSGDHCNDPINTKQLKISRCDDNTLLKQRDIYKRAFNIKSDDTQIVLLNAGGVNRTIAAEKMISYKAVRSSCVKVLYGLMGPDGRETTHTIRSCSSKLTDNNCREIFHERLQNAVPGIQVRQCELCFEDRCNSGNTNIVSMLTTIILPLFGYIYYNL